MRVGRREKRGGWGKMNKVAEHLLMYENVKVEPIYVYN